jgi:hypothetical protein
MKTIKLPVELSQLDSETVRLLREQQSSVIRIAYNRFKKDKFNQLQIRDYLKNMTFESLDSWFIQSAIMQAKGIFDKNKDSKVLFGGRFNWKQFRLGNISKLEFSNKRLLPLTCEGESPQHGNRKYKLDIISNNQIIFKPKRGTEILIKLPKLKKNFKHELIRLEKLSSQNEVAFSIKLTDENIYIIFEPSEIMRLKRLIKRPLSKLETRIKAQKKLDILESDMNRNSNRILGIDQNPNYLGVSVIEFDSNNDFKIIHKEVINFKNMNNKSGRPNSSKVSKHLINKKHFELIEICKYICNLSEHFKCSKIAIEELKFDKKDQNQGRNLNRLCNQNWQRNLFVQNLTKRCNEINLETVGVNSAYSSFVGNILYGSKNCPDMIAAAVEIARRGFKKYEKNWFYPELKSSEILHQWKENISHDDLRSWKGLYQKFKKLKVKYRFSLDVNLEFFRNSSHKSNCLRYIYLS